MTRKTGVCRVCGNDVTVSRIDGNLVRHGTFDSLCEGSEQPPAILERGEQ